MSELSWSTCTLCNTKDHSTLFHPEPVPETVSAPESVPDSLQQQPAPAPGSQRDVLPLVMADYQARMDYYAAPEQYGQPLRIDNLRDHLRDAYHEALDQTGYLKAAMVLWDEMRSTMQQIHRLSTETVRINIGTDPWIAKDLYRNILQIVAQLTGPYHS